MLEPTSARLRTLWAAPAAARTSPSWRCPSSPPCLGTEAYTLGTGCGFVVLPGAAPPPALAGPSTTGQSQVWTCWERVDGDLGLQREGVLKGEQVGTPSLPQEGQVRQSCGFWVSRRGLCRGIGQTHMWPHVITHEPDLAGSHM